MKTNANKLTIVALAMVMLVGCTQNQILALLEASVTATEVVVAMLEATGKISPTIAGDIENAIDGLPAAYQQTAAELASSDDAATKVAKVTAYYTATLASLNGLPPQAQIYAEAISASIQAFLSGLHPASAPTTLSVARDGVEVNLDSKRLEAIGLRAVELKAKLAALKVHNVEAAGGATR